MFEVALGWGVGLTAWVCRLQDIDHKIFRTKLVHARCNSCTTMTLLPEPQSGRCGLHKSRRICNRQYATHTVDPSPN